MFLRGKITAIDRIVLPVIKNMHYALNSFDFFHIARPSLTLSNKKGMIIAF